jgi:ABC-type nitrate/sulfonate/bicarbonate transport system substrate-binding protein
MTQERSALSFARSLILAGMLALAACGQPAAPTDATPKSAPAAAQGTTSPSGISQPTPAKPIDQTIRMAYPGRVAFNHSLSYIGWDTMREAGWKIEEIQFTTAVLATQGVASGAAECGWTSDSARLAAMERDPSIKLRALVENQANVWLLYGKTSINDYKELKDRPVAQGATGQINDFLLNITIARTGISPQLIRFNDSEQRSQALIAGQVDAALIAFDDVVAVERAKPGQFKAIITYKDELPDIAGSYFSCNAKFVEEHPDAVQAIIDTWILNYRRAYDDPAWFLAAVKKKLPEVNEALLREQYDSFAKNRLWDPNGHMDPKTIEATFSTYKNGGVFKSDIKIVDFADPRFIENTLRKYGEYKFKA